LGEQNGTIRNCYSTGAINGGIGSSDLGGAIGSGKGILNSFWNVETSSIGYSGGGKGRTTVQMMSSSNYFGWNNNGPVWTLDEGRDYPHLSWEQVPGTVLPSHSMADFIPGDGTAENPYRISTAEQLNIIGLYPDSWGKVFHLEADIDLSGLGDTEFNRLGIGSTSFSGVFDGQGYLIRGFTYLTEGSEWNIGLFAYSGGTLRGIHLEGVRVRSRGGLIGSLAGSAYKSISDCSSNGEITGLSGSSYIGGLIGSWSSGTLSNCSHTGTVSGLSGNQYIGGLLGITQSVDFQQCSSSGLVLAGSGSFLLPALVMGAVGGVMALAAVASHALAEMVGSYERGDLVKAREIQIRLLPVNTAVTKQFGIAVDAAVASKRI